MLIRHVKNTDLPELLAIEQAGFTPEQAATEAAFRNRIATIPDTFLVAEANDQVAGFINGPVIETEFLSDDLFTKTQPNLAQGGFQSVLGLAVAPAHQHQGIATALLKALATQAQAAQRKTVTLTCEKRLIPFYEAAGFHNEGISASDHGATIWYNMVQLLNPIA
jgi:ribosomal protein S18 acetylase RimI-like enzyme